MPILPRHPLRPPLLLGAMVLGALLVVTLGAYAFGFAYVHDERDLGEQRRLDINWKDQRLADALAELFPYQPIRFDRPIADEAVTLEVLNMPEGHIALGLSNACDVRIHRVDGIIVVADHTWLSWIYRRSHYWLVVHLGFSPWGR